MKNVSIKTNKNVQLKDLVKNDTKKARRILRNAAENGKIDMPEGYGWEWGTKSKDLKTVKGLLKDVK